MSGQFNPNPAEKDIVWRTVVEHGQYLVAVEAVHGSTKGDGWLNIWDGKDHGIIHRVRTHVSTSALLGVSQDSVRMWEEEVLKAVQYPAHRRIEVAEWPSQ